VLKCKPAVGAADTAVVRRVDRLITLLIGFVGPRLMSRRRYFPVLASVGACVEVAHKRIRRSPPPDTSTISTALSGGEGKRAGVA